METFKPTKILRGHDSPETAYVVSDYPYGFRLRCKIRYWVETTKKGQRFCSQTTNPKREGEVWNKPKKSTYSDITVLAFDEKFHVVNYGFGIIYRDEKQALEFFSTLGSLNDYERNQLKRFRAICETRKHIKISISATAHRTPEEQTAHDKEQAEIEKSIGRLYAYNLNKQGVTP